MIFDCHTHWGIVYGDRDGHDPTAWLQVLDRYNISHAIVLGHRGIADAGETVRDHDDVAAVCAQSGGRMIQFLTVHPSQGNKAIDEAVRCLDQHGARGMKFHPWIQGATVAQPVMDELAELAAARGVPLYFHDGTPSYSMPSQMAGLARRHPRTTIVLGHGGLLEHWREGIDAVRRCANVWACLCGVHPAAIREYIKSCDLARLLWGSDFGFSFSDPIAYRLGMMRSLGLPEAVLQSMFTDNPCRLLGLPT
ncbi:MAG TPA: amidohydrolase family protein [Abditibacteriaceae bacterium]|nr:amidohydrolase family protein [Abditibacteriaceae bacterium]